MIEVDVQVLVGITVIVSLALIVASVIVLQNVVLTVRNVANRVETLEVTLTGYLSESTQTPDRVSPITTPSLPDDPLHPAGRHESGSTDTTDAASPDRTDGRDDASVSRAEIGADPMPVRVGGTDRKRQRSSTDTDDTARSHTNRDRFATSTTHPPWFATTMKTPKGTIDGVSGGGTASARTGIHEADETGPFGDERPATGTGQCEGSEATFAFSESDVVDSSCGDLHVESDSSSARDRSTCDVSASLLARTDRATIESIAATTDTSEDDRNVTELFEMLLEEHGLETLQARIERYEASGNGVDETNL